MEMSNPSTTFQKAGGQVLLGKRTNCLLVKDDVGKAKPSTRKLPKEEFAFGKSNNHNIESAQQGKELHVLTFITSVHTMNFFYHFGYKFQDITNILF